ncbi:hypothetical protein ACLOJK_000712 [Asimina triloba]
MVSADELKRLPPASVAVKYYMGDDMYLFENLYDVFVNIREDEGEHCKTMKACQTHGNLRSPHLAASEEDDVGCVPPPQADCEGIVDCIKRSVTEVRMAGLEPGSLLCFSPSCSHVVTAMSSLEGSKQPKVRAYATVLC